jgi:hypothetical protein
VTKTKKEGTNTCETKRKEKPFHIRSAFRVFLLKARFPIREGLNPQCDLALSALASSKHFYNTDRRNLLRQK